MSTVVDVPVRPSAAEADATPADRREPAGKVALYLVGGILAALVFAVPLVFELFRSFQPASVFAAAPDPATFFRLTGANFVKVFAGSGLGVAVLNSSIVAVATAVITAVVATLAGYGFAKFRFRLNTWLFGFIVVTMTVPFQAILTPLYLELNAVHLTDSLIGLILFDVTFNLPFGVFVMRNSFETVPSELEDSGFVDGAGTIRMLVSVLRPLVTPGIATVALYAFLASWTEFLGALTFLTSANLYTLPLALTNLQQGAYGQVDFGVLAAGSVVAMIPAVVLYVALQRFYVSGLAAGSVKG